MSFIVHSAENEGEIALWAIIFHILYSCIHIFKMISVQ